MVVTEDTIAAIATPPGRGAVGIVRLSGANSPIIAKQLIDKGPRPQESQDLKARQAMFCSFFEQDGTQIDSGILIYYPGPASYTGEQVVELQGHGGRVVMSM